MGHGRNSPGIKVKVIGQGQGKRLRLELSNRNSMFYCDVVSCALARRGVQHEVLYVRVRGRSDLDRRSLLSVTAYRCGFITACYC